MEGRRVFFAAIVYAAIAQLVLTTGTLFTIGYLSDPAFFLFWNNMMSQGAGPAGAEFYFIGMAIAFAVGVIFAAAYELVKNNFKSRNKPVSGAKFGLFLFFVSSVPAFLIAFMFFTLPLGLLLTWLLEGLLINVAFGLAVERIFR